MLYNHDEVATEEWALTSFDPWDPRLNHSNIWDIYRFIREAGPVVRSQAYDGLWLIGRYTDVRGAGRDHGHFSSRFGVGLGKRHRDVPSAPLEFDPPEHRRFRDILAEPFKASKVGQFARLVDEHVMAISDELPVDRPIDIVDEFALEATFRVISDVIGFDPEERERNRDLSLAVINAGYEGAHGAGRIYHDFLRGAINRRRDKQMPGMLGTIVDDTEAGFTDDELLGMAHSLGLAGLHTTVNGIASTLVRAADPDIRARTLADPDSPKVIEQFVEEVLRTDPPIHLEGRRTLAPVDVGGTTIPADAQVVLLYASANHDEAQFPDPEAFLPERTASHLAFGHGVHTCVGMPLARLEMRSALWCLLDRYPGLRLAAAPVDSGMRFGHHMGWSSVLVQLR